MTHDPRRIATASLSDVGRVRTHNEDCCAEFSDANGHRLLVVADGMGGHKGGATASRVTVDTIGEIFLASNSDPETRLSEALDAANERVYRLSEEHLELRGMGTTAVVLLLDGDTCWVAHVGDSRAYRLRRGRMEPLTADHSVVGEMLRQGLISEEDAAIHPRRNEILRSVGVDPSVRPDLVQIDVSDGDQFLLCSDGLSGLLRPAEMAAVIQREPPAQAVRTLVDTANERGAPDNVTVQVAAVPGGQATEVSGSARIPTTMLDQSARERRIKRIAGITAVVAGLLALAALWLALSGETTPSPLELEEAPIDRSQPHP